MFLPFQILKSLINNKGFEENEKYEMIIGTIYESYKLKRLSSYSSIKKNYEEKDNNNIFFEILRNSKTENDDIAKNMCFFFIL